MTVTEEVMNPASRKMINSVGSSSHNYILADNCADEHVCPVSFANHIPIQPSPDPELYAAGGHKIEHYGQRNVSGTITQWSDLWNHFPGHES